MQFFSYVLLQIDEACHHIKDGRLPHLRIALLLLDNAAEIQMEKCADEYLLLEESRERLRENALRIPQEMLPDTIQEFALWQPLHTKEKRAVHRYFDEKVHYLAERVTTLDPRIAEPLIYLHRYRNEAYHHTKVRKETIETASKLLLDINCELLLNLSRGCTVYASNEDYSWLEERFPEVSSKLLHTEEFVSRAVAEFRSAVDLDDKSIALMLVQHFESRIKDVFDALDFILENTRYPDHETVIKDSYHRGIARRDRYGIDQKKFKNSESRHTLKCIEDIKNGLSDIIEAQDRFESFRHFSVLEIAFEPVEENIHELAAEVDCYIQMQIDIARGK